MRYGLGIQEVYFGMSSDWPNRNRVVIKPQGPPISIKVSLDPLSMHYAGDLLVVTLCATDPDDAMSQRLAEIRLRLVSGIRTEGTARGTAVMRRE